MKQKMMILMMLGVGIFLAAFGAQDTAAQFGIPDTIYKVTVTGTYKLTVRGGDGGNLTKSGGAILIRGGKGASVSANFTLKAGDQLTQVTGDLGGVAGALKGGGGYGRTGGGGGGIATNGTLGGGAYIGSGSGRLPICGGGSGGGFNGNGLGIGGLAGTLNGGGYGAPSCNFVNFNGARGGSGFGGGGGGGYGGGALYGFTVGVRGGDGGSSFVAASGTYTTRVNGATGLSNSYKGSVSVTLLPAGTLAPTVSTVSTVSVSGFVKSFTSRGIRNVLLTLTDSSGQIISTTQTTSLGYYRFDDVEAGQTYILSAVGKHYTFSQPLQVLYINEETNEVNFVANSEKSLIAF